MVGPNYRSPENSVADEWQGEASVFSHEAPMERWWEIFGDVLLSTYMERAALYNRDLLAAEAAILQARALRQVAASSLFPQLVANVNATKTYFSKNGPVFAGSSLTEGPSSTTGLPFQIQVPQVQNLYNVLFDASWEIDLFGKTRRTVEAAEAHIGAAIEHKNDTMISIFAEIARNYLEIRATQKRMWLIEEEIELLEEEEGIVEREFTTGYANQLDLDQVEAQLSAVRATLPETIAQIYQGIYALSILIGEPPETLVEELIPVQPLPSIPDEIAIGLRSDLLRRRPDVRQKERDLAEATAYIGVAVASFYPSLSLGADLGLQSLKLKNLFQAASKTWDYGGDISLPIFEGGKQTGNLKLNRATASAAAYTYQQTVLNALQEAESALMAYSEDLATSHQWKENRSIHRRLLYLTQERYEKGLVNRMNVIASELELNGADQNVLGSDAQALFDLVTLYKALGGGWEHENSQPVRNPLNAEKEQRR
jgi:outer membrane protein, multidrug efflux system